MKRWVTGPVGLIAAAAVALGVVEFRGHPVPVFAIDRELYLHETGLQCKPGGIVSGVLRNDGAGWYALDDDGHTPTNIRSVESDWKSITVHFAFDAKDIHTFIVSSDEAFSAKGISGGASVATNKARIAIGRDGLLGNSRTSPLWVDTDRFPGSNFWIYGMFDADCAI